MGLALTELSEADWSEMGVTLGHKCAIKHVLEERPRRQLSPAALPPALRRFLSIDGTMPLGSTAALFYASLLHNECAHMQQLLITIGEIMAIIGGFVAHNSAGDTDDNGRRW